MLHVQFFGFQTVLLQLVCRHSNFCRQHSHFPPVSTLLPLLVGGHVTNPVLIAGPVALYNAVGWLLTSSILHVCTALGVTYELFCSALVGASKPALQCGSQQVMQGMHNCTACSTLD